MPTNINLPANLPENWQAGQIVSPSGTEVGLSAQHGYNYLMQQVNDTQEAANALSQAVDSQEEAQAQLETDVETLQTDMTQAKSDVETLQTDVGNLQTGQGQLATPNATATHSDSVVAITAPAGVNLISFYAPSDFSGDDTYTVNGSAVTLTDLNGNAIYDGWKEGAPVQLILKGAQAFFKSGGGVNDTLPPLNPNMTMEQADGVFTVTADKLPVAQADALAGAEWYYADHVPARPGDGTKVEFERSQLVNLIEKSLNSYSLGSTVNINVNGFKTEFLVLKHGYPNSDNGRTLLYQKIPYGAMVWDSASGSVYANSSIDDFCEITYANLFDQNVINLITPVNIVSGGGTIERRFFLLSYTELGFTENSGADVEGEQILYFSGDSIRMAEFDDAPANYWTRTNNKGNTTTSWIVGVDGKAYAIASNMSASPSPNCARIAFTLPSNTKFNKYTNEIIIPSVGGTKPASEYTQGSIVKIKESGVVNDFIVLQHGYPSLDNGLTLFCRKDIFSILGSISTVVPSDYEGSSLDNYMENTYKAVLSPYVRNLIQPVNIAISSGENGEAEINRSIFALSNGELGDTLEPIIGTAIPYFSSDAQRISNYDSHPTHYATRFFGSSGVLFVCTVLESGTFRRVAIGSLTNVGVRPAFVLPSNTLFNADTNELIEDASGVQTLADTTNLGDSAAGSTVTLDSGEVITDNGSSISVAIPWSESGYCYCRQFPYNAKHQYQTQLVGAVATNDPVYGTSLDPVLENNSWDKIAEASESGIASDVWQVGDTKDIVVGDETLTVEIVGFDHDDLSDGSGKAGITFGLKNLMANTRKMNSSNTNTGGFTGSDMYEWLQGTLLNSLPSDLQAVLKSVNKKTSAGNKSSTINTNAMKIFLFSEIEIFGTVTHSAPGEGSQYSRFATTSSRIKYLSNGSGSANFWWERSPYVNGSNNFCVVNSDGDAGRYDSSISRGVCFGFCV